MRFIAFSLCLIGSAVVAGEHTSIPKPLAEAILAESVSLGERIQKQMVEDQDAADVKLVELSRTLENSSQWRYYYRDRGILIAISVKQRMNYLDRVDAENEIAQIAARLVLQSENRSVEGGIRVVFIEPESPCSFPRVGRRAVSGIQAGAGTACGCR